MRFKFHHQPAKPIAKASVECLPRYGEGFANDDAAFVDLPLGDDASQNSPYVHNLHKNFYHLWVKRLTGILLNVNQCILS